MALWIVHSYQNVDIGTRSGFQVAMVGTFIVLVVWVLVLIPLAFLWFGTRPRL